jgi:hypothetical protein
MRDVGRQGAAAFRPVARQQLEDAVDVAGAGAADRDAWW